MHRRTLSLRTMLLTFLAASVLTWSPAHASRLTTGFVYVATNESPVNSVIQFWRAGDGSLTPIGEAATGGSGTGAGTVDPLGSQDSLVLSPDGTYLLVVNAGDNTVSLLSAGSAGLQSLSTVSSNGTFPNSVALYGDLVYVLNAKGTPDISGFRISATGTLTAIPNSTQSLPGGSDVAPHDIRFSPDGTRLIVTDGGANQIDVFQLDANGLATSVITTSDAGSGPFGLRFGRDGALICVEAASASASSYSLLLNDTLSVISPAVANGQKASCWISVTGDGKFAFVSDTGSGTFSSYQVSGNGALNLANAIAASTDGAAPIDSALSGDSAFFYVVDSSHGNVLIYRVHGASLHALGSVTGLPASTQGIAAQ